MFFNNGHSYFLFEGDFETYTPGKFADIVIGGFITTGGPLFIDVQMVITDAGTTTLNRPLYDIKTFVKPFGILDRRLRSTSHPNRYDRHEVMSINAPIDKLLIRPPEEQPVDLSKFYPCYNVLHVPMIGNYTGVGKMTIHANKDKNGKKTAERPYKEE